MQFLEFMFRSGWHFFGMAILIIILFWGLEDIIRAFKCKMAGIEKDTEEEE